MQRFLVAHFLAGLVSAILAGPALAQPTSITWWEHSNPPHNNYSQELVAEWNKKHPDTQVQYDFFAMTPYFKKLSVALSTKSAADMFTVIDTLLPSFTTKNVLAPIHPEWLGYKNLEDMKKAYLPGALEGYIHNGKLYAVPMVSATFSLYINTDHFKEAGLDPENDYPKTWEDIGRIGQKLVKKDVYQKLDVRVIIIIVMKRILIWQKDLVTMLIVFPLNGLALNQKRESLMKRKLNIIEK